MDLSRFWIGWLRRFGAIDHGVIVGTRLCRDHMSLDDRLAQQIKSIHAKLISGRTEAGNGLVVPSNTDSQRERVPQAAHAVVWGIFQKYEREDETFYHLIEDKLMGEVLLLRLLTIEYGAPSGASPPGSRTPTNCSKRHSSRPPRGGSGGTTTGGARGCRRPPTRGSPPGAPPPRAASSGS